MSPAAKRMLSAAVLLWAGFLCPACLFSQSILNIPRVVWTPDLFTGVAIANPAGTEAAVTFTAYQPDGAPLLGVMNPVTLTIPAAGQITRSVRDIFAAGGSFSGWVQVSSSAAGLAGYFLNSNTSVTDFAASGAADAAAEWILPLASEDDTASTELTLVNPNTDAASVTITLYGAEGRVLTSGRISLNGHALGRQTLKALFGANANLATASHLRLSADRPVVTVEAVVNYRMSDNDPNRQTVTVTGQPLTAGTRYVVPGFVSGSGWLSFLGLVNGAGVSQQVTVTAHKEDGTRWESTSNPTRIALNGNGGLRSSIDALFGFSGDTLRTGWIEVTGPAGYLSSYVATGNTRTPSLAVVAAMEATAAPRTAAFAQVSDASGFFTSLAAVNAGTTAAIVELYVLRPDGSLVGKATSTLGANQRTGGQLTELVPASLKQPAGWVFVRSSQPVIATGLLGTLDGAVLTSLAAQTVPSAFQPAAQTTAAITGSVRASDRPVPGVEMRLSGPVLATTVTDNDGRYIFTPLPAGNYQVTPALAAAQFSPSARTFAINLQNVDGADFQVGGLETAGVPQIQFLTPSSSFAGIGTFSIRMLGSNFTPASVVAINGQAIETVFVDTTELRVVLPASLSVQPGKLIVSVVTPPPGGGTSAAVEFMVVAAPQNPLIAGRAAAGAFPSGVAIDSVRNTALVTNQSGDNVSIIDLGSRNMLGEVPAGRSPAEGIAIDRDRDIALVANPGSDNVTVIDLKTNTVAATIPVGAFPIGVAIDAARSRALVVNGETDNITIINLNALTVVGTVPVGRRPAGIAVNPKTNQAVVTNRAANTVTVIDLTTDTQLGTITVGPFPRGVAIHPDTNQAVVANANGGMVSIIDLSTRTVIATVPVGVGPTGVAIHTLTNHAMVTNSGVAQGSAALPAQTTVSIINLTSQTVVATVPVGSAAFGIDADQTRQVAVIADYGSNDITVIRIPNPRPRVDDIQPKVFPIGVGKFTITVTGSGFVPTSVVTLNGQPLPTTYISPSEVRAEISTTLFNQALQGGSFTAGITTSDSPKAFPAVTAPQLNIGVSNPAPGGGDSPPPSNPSANQLQVLNGVPVLLSMAPDHFPADKTDLTLVLNGNNFNATSFINFGSALLSPQSVTLTAMTVLVPRDLLKTAGTVGVSITNPPLGGGASATLSFRIDAQENPVPLVRRVNPPSVASDSGPQTVTVQGSGFFDGTQATLAGTPGKVGGDTIIFNLTANQTDNAGTLTGVITNLSPGGGSAIFTVSVLNPAPSITNFTPASAVVGTPVTLTVNGTNFRRSSTITIEGTPIPTTFSSTVLTATIPGAFLRKAEQIQIGVNNPAPGGGTVPGDHPLLVTRPRPVLSSVTPSPATVQLTDLTVQLTGTGFTEDSIVTINGTNVAAVYNSPTSMSATVPASVLAQAGTLRIVMTNPPPGGGTTDPLPLPVVNPVPVIISVEPDKFSGDQENVVLTVKGDKFVDGATVFVGKQALRSTFVSSSQLTASFSPPLPVGNQTVTVVNPIPGGGTSNGFTVQIKALLPTITSVTPSSAALGQTITVVGINFGPGSVLLFRGTALPTTVANSTTLSAVIPTNAATGSADVVVQNPATASDPPLTSAPFTIQIIYPVPVINTLDPASIQIGSSSSVTVQGTGFVPVSQIQVNGQTAVATFVDAATLTFALPTNIAAGSANVTVVNPTPGGGTSNAGILMLTNPPVLTHPPAIISSISPVSVQAGSITALTVHGSNFVNGAVINFGSSPLPTTFINDNTLSAIVNAPFPGLFNITVTNPGAPSSNAVIFTIVLPPVPTLSVISPSTGNQDTSVAVTLTGTDFIPDATTVDITGTGVTVRSVNVSGSTALMAVFSIDAAATTGDRNVTVTTPNGTSNSVTFTVTFGTEQINNGGFESGSPQLRAGEGALPVCAGFWCDSSRTGSVIVDSAHSGMKAVEINTVESSIGHFIFQDLQNTKTTFTWKFYVLPNQGANTAALIASWDRIAGSVPVSSVSFDDDGVSFSSWDNSLRLTPALSAGVWHEVIVQADATARNQVLLIDGTVSGQLTAAGSTTIVAPQTVVFGDVSIGGTALHGLYRYDDVSLKTTASTPTLAAIIPSSGVAGNSITVTLTGSEFVTGATAINVASTGVTVANVNVSYGHSLTATLTLAPNATIGAHDVTVMTPVGASNPVIFTVQAPPPPAVTQISPNFGVRGPNVSITMTGTNFVAGFTTLTVSGTGVTTQSVNVTSEMSLTAVLIIDVAAATGARDVTVTTPGGSATIGFTVYAVPALTSIKPSLGVVGTSVPVTVTGANFVFGATTLIVSGTGITASSVTVTSGVSLTATLVIDATAALGGRDVRVSTRGGTTAGVTFTVVGPPISYTSFSIVGGTLATNGGGLAVVNDSGARAVGLPPGETPGLIAASPDGSRLYIGVSTSSGYSLHVIDTSDNHIVTTANICNKTSTVSCAGGSGLAATNTGAYAGFTTVGSSFTINGGGLAVVNDSGSRPVSLPSGEIPELTAASPDGSRAYVGFSSSSGYGVHVIDTSDNHIVTTANICNKTSTLLCAGGSGLAATSAGAYAAFTTVGSAFAINGGGLAFVNDSGSRAISLPSGEVPGLTAAGPDGSRVYLGVSTASGYSVRVLDTSDNHTVTTAQICSDTPTLSCIEGSGLSATNAGAYASFNSISGTLVINGGGLARVNDSGSGAVSLPSGEAPGLTAASPDGSRVYVGFNSSSGYSVHVIDTSNNQIVTTPRICSRTSAACAGGIGLLAISGPVNTVPVPAPTISSVSPSTGTQGATILGATITGTNLAGATAVTFSGTGVTGSVVSVETTSISLNITINSTAATGARDVLVTTSGGTATLTGGFTVAAPSPTLSSINPSSGLQGSSVPVTLTGTNFISGGTTVNISGGTGITVTSVTVTSGTSLNATFIIDSTATTGNRGITVSTSAGTSGSVTFTITVPAPTISSISPSTGTQGATILGATITGTNLAGATAVTFSGTGVTGSVVSVEATSISLNITINSTAATGARDVLVTTSGGTATLTGGFTVAAPGAVRPGFAANTLPGNDDGSTSLVPIGFPINFFGHTYTGLFVNNNGNLTLDQQLVEFTPFPLTTTQRVIIAPFFADVDTRVGSVLTYGSGTVNGHAAFGVTWPGVGCFSLNINVLNFFQVLLIDRSDVGTGDFDIEFNYNSIQWETGQASGGNAACLGGTAVRVGYSNGSGVPGTFFELPGSGVPGSFLDSNTLTGLIHNSLNGSQLGRYLFAVRNGVP